MYAYNEVMQLLELASFEESYKCCFQPCVWLKMSVSDLYYNKLNVKLLQSIILEMQRRRGTQKTLPQTMSRQIAIDNLPSFWASRLK